MKIQKEPKREGESFIKFTQYLSSQGSKLNKTKRRKSEGQNSSNFEGKTQEQFNVIMDQIMSANTQYFLESVN